MNKLQSPKALWEQRFAATEYIFGTEPNRYLASRQRDLKPGRALVIADGEGRNGVWLARQGLQVDSFDFVQGAVDKALKLADVNQVSLNATCSDWQGYDWGQARYDNMVAVFIQFAGPAERPELFRRMDEALKPGGLLLIQGYSPQQLEFNTGGPGKLENLYTEELLREAFPHYQILDSRTYTEAIEEGTAHSGQSGLIGFAAIKR